LGGVLFRERLTVPWVWWLLAVLFALSMLVALGLYVGLVWGVGVAVASMLVAVGIFASAAVVISVDAQEIRVGRAVIEHRYIGAARALDAAETRNRSGVQADARAHLVLRPYVSTAVEITLDDPADPVPYWLISSRRPTELAAALDRAASTTVAE
jgi:hypothetical protein